MKRVKNSLGIWALGAKITRFVPAGYHPDAGRESMVDKTKRATDGLHDLLDGLEFHCPGEVNEDNIDGIIDAACDRLGPPRRSDVCIGLAVQSG